MFNTNSFDIIVCFVSPIFYVLFMGDCFLYKLNANQQNMDKQEL